MYDDNGTLQLLTAKARGRGPRRGSNGSRKGYRYYACRTRQAHGAERCAGVYVPAADLEPAVIGCVREICADPSIRAEVGRRLDAGEAAIADDLTKERAVLEERIEKLTAEGKALVASIEQMGGKGGTLLPARLGEIEAELDGPFTAPFPPGREPFTERHLRRVLQSPIWAEQRAVWRRLRPAQVVTER